MTDAEIDFQLVKLARGHMATWQDEYAELKSAIVPFHTLAARR